MSNEEIEKNVREYIHKTAHMSLATSRDNKPWVCEVHFANDESLNLYFVSPPSTRHCQEIVLNPLVAGNIVKQHPLTESPHGVYFEGRAGEISATNKNIENYCQRLERDAADLKSQLLEPGGRRMYKITVDNWSIFGKFGGGTNQKYALVWNGGKK